MKKVNTRAQLPWCPPVHGSAAKPFPRASGVVCSASRGYALYTAVLAAALAASFARNTRRNNLPVGVRGSSATTSISRGIL